MTSYQVELDTFHGPLDLLLYLVQKHEIDIFDIPIHLLTTRFLDFLHGLQVFDLDKASDYLVMAVTLLEIKCQALLPEPEETNDPDEPTADPRRELVQQLLEYRKSREAMQALENLAEQQAARYPRLSPVEPEAVQTTTVRSVELWDLVSAFGRMMHEKEKQAPVVLVSDDTPLSAYQEQIRARLVGRERVLFRDLFTPPHHRLRLVGLFLALLELVRRFEIEAEQPEPFGEIWLRWCVNPA
jgi:segregation and condensation protein A